MAAIGNIRKHYGLLVVIVGIALLAFVLGDLFKSTNSGKTTNIAIVDGEKISYQDYSNLVNMELENRKAQKGGTLSAGENYNAHANTLERMIRNIIMKGEYEALNLAVSNDELYDLYVGEEPHQWIAQQFSNPDGTLNTEIINTYIRDFQNLTPEQKSYWLNLEEAIRENRIQTKYETLLKKSFYLPNKLAARIYADNNDKSSVEVYSINYQTIADSTVVINDADNKAFYEKYKKHQFLTKKEDARNIDYLVFEINPSQDDFDNSKNFVNDLKDELAQIENVANFVKANSDLPYDSLWKSREDVPAEFESVIFDENNGVGFVYGPYEYNGYYNIAKITETGNRSDSLMASHILVGYANALRSDATRTKEEAKTLADSILNVVNANDTIFNTIAGSLSDDPSAKENNGDLGWFMDGSRVYTFNEFVQNNAVGTTGIVETPYGYHIVKVTGRNDATPKVRIAVVANEIAPSTTTFQNIFAEANNFVTENNTAELFNSAIEEQGLNKRTIGLTTITSYIPGISDPRQIVRWAFDKKTEVGDMSSIFELENMYVVAVLTKAVEKGLVPYEDITEEDYQILVKKEKKGEMLAEKAKAYGSDYQKMIDEMNGTKTVIDDVAFNDTYFGRFAVEDKVLGTVIGMKEGETSEPIIGGNGLFIVKVTKETPAEAN